MKYLIALLALACVGGARQASVEPSQGPRVMVAFDPFLLGQAKFLVLSGKTEFTGCVYGRHTVTEVQDTIELDFLIPSNSQFSKTSDSRGHQLGCPNLSDTTAKFVAVFHTHIVGMGIGGCTPSEDDYRWFGKWESSGALLGLIFCDKGNLTLGFTEKGPVFIHPSPPDSVLYAP